MHIFSTNKYKVTMPSSTTRESKSSHLYLQSNTLIHLLPKKSRIHYKAKFPSNFQCYNIVTHILSVNNYNLNVPGNTPNVYLTPPGNANDKKNYPHPFLLFYTFPQEIHSPLSVHSHTFQVLVEPSSWAVHALGRIHHIRRYKNQSIYLPQMIIPVISCSCKSMDTIEY